MVTNGILGILRLRRRMRSDCAQDDKMGSTSAHLETTCVYFNDVGMTVMFFNDDDFFNGYECQSTVNYFFYRCGFSPHAYGNFRTSEIVFTV
jgi:hypothetical protein